MSAVYGGPLVPSVSIENLVGQRAAVLERIQQATALLLEANAIATQAGLGFPTICLASGYSRQVEYRLSGSYREEDNGAGFLETARVAVDIGAWQHLMHESGLRTLMDAASRAEWDQQFQKKEIPPLTVDNIRRTFATLYESRAVMFERGVVNCFRKLAWCYKTNLPHKFGKRIVLQYLRNSVTGNGRSLGFPNSRTCDELDDLLRVFAVMDGKPEPDHRNAMHRLLSAQDNIGAPVIETEYLQIKTFRNGNGHVLFKRPDLVDQLNRIIGRHFPNALPAPK